MNAQEIFTRSAVIAGYTVPSVLTDGSTLPFLPLYLQLFTGRHDFSPWHALC
jgi:hypothetical protein